MVQPNVIGKLSYPNGVRNDLMSVSCLIDDTDWQQDSWYDVGQKLRLALTISALEPMSEFSITPFNGSPLVEFSSIAVLSHSPELNVVETANGVFKVTSRAGGAGNITFELTVNEQRKHREPDKPMSHVIRPIGVNYTGDTMVNVDTPICTY